MQLSDEEKTLLKHLVQKELKEFQKEEEEILTEMPPMLAAEGKYEKVLRELKEKLK
jgi:hypothetical protein